MNFFTSFVKLMQTARPLFVGLNS